MKKKMKRILAVVVYLCHASGKPAGICCRRRCGADRE